MTTYEVTIIGYGGEAITDYDGEDENEYRASNERIQKMLRITPHEVAYTTRTHKDGEVWYQEANYFLG